MKKELLLAALLMIANIGVVEAGTVARIEEAESAGLISVSKYPRVLVFHPINVGISAQGQLLVCRIPEDDRYYTGSYGRCEMNNKAKTNKFEDALSIAIPGYEIDSYKIQVNTYGGTTLTLFYTKK
jgi:hypothetical protein